MSKQQAIKIQSFQMPVERDVETLRQLAMWWNKETQTVARMVHRGEVSWSTWQAVIDRAKDATDAYYKAAYNR